MWAAIASDYLMWDDTEGPADEVARRLAAGEAPLAIGTRIDPKLAERSLGKSIDFLLFVINATLEDHVLNDEEVHVAGHLLRVLRVQGGDFLKYRREDTSAMMGAELTRVLADGVVTPSEASQKLKLQALLGLSFDEYTALLPPERARTIKGWQHH